MLNITSRSIMHQVYSLPVFDRMSSKFDTDRAPTARRQAPHFVTHSVSAPGPETTPRSKLRARTQMCSSTGVASWLLPKGQGRRGSRDTGIMSPEFAHNRLSYPDFKLSDSLKGELRSSETD